MGAEIAVKREKRRVLNEPGASSIRLLFAQQVVLPVRPGNQADTSPASQDRRKALHIGITVTEY